MESAVDCCLHIAADESIDLTYSIYRKTGIPTAAKANSSVPVLYMLSISAFVQLFLDSFAASASWRGEKEDDFGSATTLTGSLERVASPRRWT